MSLGIVHIYARKTLAKINSRRTDDALGCIIVPVLRFQRRRVRAVNAFDMRYPIEACLRPALFAMLAAAKGDRVLGGRIAVRYPIQQSTRYAIGFCRRTMLYSIALHRDSTIRYPPSEPPRAKSAVCRHVQAIDFAQNTSGTIDSRPSCA